MAERRLEVWLYGRHVARLTEPSRYRYRLDFTEEALDVYGVGSRVLSLALPVEPTPVVDGGTGSRGVSAFLEGLLPEGNLRRHLATTLGVPTIDKMSLLRQVGAECAGAVQFLPAGHEPGDGDVRRLTGEELDRLVSDLPTYHLPEGAEPQASLAGIQDKVLLTRMSDGSWGWPQAGAVSTHIVKPEPTSGAVLPHLVQTEDWALRVAHEAGLRSAEARLETFGGRRALVVSRYDRDESRQRIHQEDFCQALGLDPEAKYESTVEYERSGSRLSRLARLAADRSRDPFQFRLDLLAAVTFNVVIGNGDAHSKNYSVLIGERGEVSMAPLYDTAPVAYISPGFKGTGHVIAGRTSIDRVDVDDLASEASSWGISKRVAQGAVRDVMERVRAAADDRDLPDGAESVRSRLEAMWVRRSWPAPPNLSRPATRGTP